MRNEHLFDLVFLVLFTIYHIVYTTQAASGAGAEVRPILFICGDLSIILLLFCIAGGLKGILELTEGTRAFLHGDRSGKFSHQLFLWFLVLLLPVRSESHFSSPVAFQCDTTNRQVGVAPANKD